MSAGRYKSSWFGWCELCGKRRLRIHWWSQDGIAYDTVCGRCTPAQVRRERERLWNRAAVEEDAHG